MWPQDWWKKQLKKPTESVTMGVILGERFPAGGLFLMPQLKVYVPKDEPRSKKNAGNNGTENPGSKGLEVKVQFATDVANKLKEEIPKPHKSDPV